MGTTVGSSYETLIDLAMTQDKKGNVIPVVEILSQHNAMVNDMPIVSANETTGHKFAVEVELPMPSFGAFNKGVASTKGRQEQVEEDIAFIPDRSTVDKREAQVILGSEYNKWRSQKDRKHIRAIANRWQHYLIYGNTGTNSDGINGLATRYSSGTAANSTNIVNGGGSGSTNTSIYVINWSPDTAFGIIPPNLSQRAGNTVAGVKVEPLPEQDALDRDSNPFRAWVVEYEQWLGLCIPDWRSCVRIANIDTSALTKAATSGADLIDLLTIALSKVEQVGMNNCYIYANRLVTTFLRRQIVNKVASSTLGMDQVGGKEVMTFCGYPFRLVDPILNTEAAVTGLGTAGTY